MPKVGLEPTHLLRAADFESAASAIPPLWLILTLRLGAVVLHNDSACCSYIEATNTSILPNIQAMLGDVKNFLWNSNLFLTHDDEIVLGIIPFKSINRLGISNIINGYGNGIGYIIHCPVEFFQSLEMPDTGILMGSHSTTTIPLLLAIDPNFLCQEGIGVADHRGDIEIIAKITTNHSKVVPLGVEVSEDRFMRPVVVVVNDIAGFNRATLVLWGIGQVGA